MRRLLILIFALAFTLSPYAQSNKTTRKKPKTTAVRKKTSKKKSNKQKPKSIKVLKNEKNQVRKNI